MMFKIAITTVILSSLFLVVQLGNANHHIQAELVIKVATAITAFLLASRLTRRENRKLGWHTIAVALIPVSMYLVFCIVLNGTGGLGAAD